MNDPHSELWLTLIRLLTEEDLLRFIRRASIVLPESPQRYDLITAFETELLTRDLMKEIKPPRLRPLYE